MADIVIRQFSSRQEFWGAIATAMGYASFDRIPGPVRNLLYPIAPAHWAAIAMIADTARAQGAQDVVVPEQDLATILGESQDADDLALKLALMRDALEPYRSSKSRPVQALVEQIEMILEGQGPAEGEEGDEDGNLPDPD